MDNYDKILVSTTGCLGIFCIFIIPSVVGGIFYVTYLLLRYFGVI